MKNGIRDAEITSIRKHFLQRAWRNKEKHLERFKEPDLFGKAHLRTVYGKQVVDQNCNEKFSLREKESLKCSAFMKIEI